MRRAIITARGDGENAGCNCGRRGDDGSNLLCNFDGEKNKFVRIEKGKRNKTVCRNRKDARISGNVTEYNFRTQPVRNSAPTCGSYAILWAYDVRRVIGNQKIRTLACFESLQVRVNEKQFISRGKQFFFLLS